jgi:UDP-N-acetylglucosamine/UDP-N-acetylgalactosamine diphosphorylase
MNTLNQQATPHDDHLSLQERLRQYGQEHLLRFHDELPDEQKAILMEQVASQDWEHLKELIQSHVVNKPDAEIPQGLEPPPFYPLTPSPELVTKYAQARALGERLIREGQVAAFTVAGGQGTRLGWDGPKGTFPATPILHKPLFQVFAEYLLKVQEKYQTRLPWYIMTSPINDEATRRFFQEHGFFGLEPQDVMFFSQGTMPAIGFDGKILLGSKGELALSPDGHGGSLKALYRSGAIADMERRGVTQVSYFQVDNPNVKCIDPLFLGLHALDGAQMSSKMLPKASPTEKVGNFAQRDGRIQIIEYSDMPDELAESRNPDGSLRFNAGSIAIHVIAVEFVKGLNENSGRFGLPYHRAEKKVEHIDPETGETRKPAEPNAVKLEAFVFDALPLAERSIILETDRIEEFAPIKNAEGTDSPATSRALQSQRAARWLASHGVEVPWGPDGDVDAVIELSHLTAIEPADLQGKDLPAEVQPGSEVVL